MPNKNRVLKNLFRFFITNFKEVSFGGLLTFLSSFGQTFLISLYVPEIIKTYSFTEGTFGAIYAGCTMLASFIMLTVGHHVDHVSIKRVTGLTILGLAVSNLILGFSNHISLLIISIIGLRLTGQGLLSHISLTIISKHYNKDRGKALSIAALGYSIGEAIFPILISSLIVWYNWRIATIIIGIGLILYLIKLKFTNLEHFNKQLLKSKKTSIWELIKNYKNLIFEKRFLIIMPASFSMVLTVTALFFYQYVFVESKGWSPTLYAAFFTGYAFTRFIFSIVGGIWVDKFTAKTMFKSFLIPMTLGLLVFAFSESIIGALIFLLLTGITFGISSPVRTAVLAEIYGTENLGAIRSLFTMFTVISSALGPLIVGYMIDINIDYKYIILLLFGFVFSTFLNSLRIKDIKSVN